MTDARVALLSVLLLTGCGSIYSDGSEALAAPAKRAAGFMYDSAEDGEGSSGAASSAPAPASDVDLRTEVVGAIRLRIYSGRLDVLVANLDDSIGRLLGRAQELGGYLENRSDRVVTCRVPAARFDDALVFARGLGQVLGESVKAEDVTRRHVDLRVRIENAERARERLLELLGRATETTAILEIEKELRRLTEEIETMKAEMNWLNDQIAFSTLTVAFQTDAPPPVHRRTRSRFPWLERVGLEPLLEQF